MPVVDMSKIAIRSGRYTGAARASEPPGGLPRRRSTKSAPIGKAAVVDPWGDGRTRIQVQTNRQCDALEIELSHGRISEGAYEVGRVVQAAIERTIGMRGSNWSGGERVDAQTSAEMALLHTLDNARTAVRVMDRMSGAIGTVGARFLRSILVEGQTFADAAAARGRTARYAGTYAGQRFRDLLEDLSTEWGAKGKTGTQVVAGFAEAPDAVTVEDPNRAPRLPLSAGRSGVTASHGRRALKALAGEDKTAQAAAVRRGIRSRG